MEECWRLPNDLSSISSDPDSAAAVGQHERRLKNRRAVHSRLSQLHHPGQPSAARQGSGAAHELNNKINFAKELSFRERLACSDIQDIGKTCLKLKAVSKIRVHSPESTPSGNDDQLSIPQNTLLEIQFLLANIERTVAKEIRGRCVDTMGKIYYSYFQMFITGGRLLKVQVSSPNPVSEEQETPSSLGRGPFRSTSGWRPIWFHITAQRGDSQEYVRDTCPAATTAYAIFPVHIHIITRFRAITAKERNIPLSTSRCPKNWYCWEAVLELLWPRFELILEMNIHSIRNTDPQKLGVLDTRPHYITRRYAEFSSAIVSINQTFPNERTNTLLGQLQVEVENFVLKVEFPPEETSSSFLINNYDMMVSSWRRQATVRWKVSSSCSISPELRRLRALMEKTVDRLKSEEARITQLVGGFSIIRAVGGVEVSQGVMRSFLLQKWNQHHSSYKILNQPRRSSLADRLELISLHHLMVEVKKHKPNF
ncbi:vacuolar protein sorting-associated protein 52 homolog isoform X3 [Lates japonicus]|uniref:Vacuolar protein sorting-associated protein 52 homolog isoform X3 n=1 Tax=Lates japonicus TaxID=270547 RepID=A0AAD3MR52_LATJO|nr:vacuolar protein sorting-associated protein 52 homolog isoform X3 [Lates japonicus]